MSKKTKLCFDDLIFGKKIMVGKKIGNAHLKWAFSEAAVLFSQEKYLSGKVPGEPYEKTRQGEVPEYSGP